jgi:hypothetical protein
LGVAAGAAGSADAGAKFRDLAGRNVALSATLDMRTSRSVFMALFPFNRNSAFQWASAHARKIDI